MNSPNHDTGQTTNSQSYTLPYSLDPIFYPKSIVLVDGLRTPGSAADCTWKNLTSTFIHGPLKMISSADAHVPRSFPPETDLAVIVVPAGQEENVLSACSAAGCKGALVLSPDHREAIADSSFAPVEATQYVNMRMLGPRSFGIIVPHHDLNITPLLPTPRQGNIALISQSGALCTAVLDWSFRTGMGFSAIVSSGGMQDVDWHDLITYFGDDPYTKSIVIYLETIDDTRSFLSAAREVALSKPIIVLKAGRSSSGTAGSSEEARRHERSDALLDAALQRVGVLRVRTIAELFYMANILATQPLPKGPRLTIITNAIGPAVMATDTLLASGGQLAELSPDAASSIINELQGSPPVENPINVLGDATPKAYTRAIEAVAKDKSTDGLLVILTPQQVTHATETARQVVRSVARIGKPVLTSWMGGDRVAEGQNVLVEAGIPAFPYPDTPARLFALMWRQSQNLHAIYETPVVVADEDTNPTDAESVNIMIEGVRAQGRIELNEWESKAILRAYGIPVVETLPALSEDEAVTCAQILGYPVLLKLLSLSHSLKEKLHGVRISLRDEQDVREAFRSIRDSVLNNGASVQFQGCTVQKMVSTKGIELLAGTRIDAQFGPYMYFGTGGQMHHIVRDYALGLPPLTTALAQRMIERTRAWKAISPDIGACDERLLALQSLLVRLSQLVVQHPVLNEVEINPLLSTTEGIVALDARITLHASTVAPAELPRPAIRPYPIQYTWKEKLKNNTTVIIRPVRPEDEPLIVEFHKELSEETIYRRYFFQHKLTRRTSHERLRRTCFLDFDREIALAALMMTPSGEKKITAVGRMARSRSGDSAEIAMVVADPYQGNGLGTLMLRHLVDIARAEGIKRLEGTMLPGNMHMQHLFTRLGFTVEATGRESLKASRIL